MKKFTTIDLFAGAGGLSYGFCKTGYFDVRVAVEYNTNAQETYVSNHENIHIESDIRGVNYEQLKKRYGQFDVVIGGPPCQGFSNANRQKNELVSGNNQLVNEYIRAIEELQPIAFVMENVKTICSNKHRFFCSEKIQNAIKTLGVSLHDDVIAISEATVSPERFIEFLQTCDNLTNYALSKDNYVKINTIYRNAKTNEQLKKYIEKYKSTILKLINIWDGFHTHYWNEEYRRNFVETKELLRGYLIDGQNFDILKIGLNTIVETQKAIYKMQEIREYNINLLGMRIEKRNICIVVKTYNVIEYVLKKFCSMGYEVEKGVLNAAQFGVPQNRERFIIIGIKKESLKAEKVALPEPILNSAKDYFTIGHAIKDLAGYKTEKSVNSDPVQKKDRVPLNLLQGHLDDSDFVYNHIITDTQETALERFKQLNQGQNFHHLEDDLKSSYSDPTRTQNTIYLRLSYKVPSGTVVNVRKSMWIHPTRDRAISVREAARLQSFPDSFRFFGTKDSQYQQVGNAVPPLLGRAIAEKLLELLGEQPKERLRDIITDNGVLSEKCSCE